MRVPAKEAFPLFRIVVPRNQVLTLGLLDMLGVWKGGGRCFELRAGVSAEVRSSCAHDEKAIS